MTKTGAGCDAAKRDDHRAHDDGLRMKDRPALRHPSAPKADLGLRRQCKR
ncbi:hypothetical protein GWL_19290 [Herbaspirillum sp. GW103]|nr:hypothetical protein GWL_19290 [Herbaspirillum sp. GW103]